LSQVQVKHIENNQFTHDATAQLPTYLKGEEAAFGIYVCIGYWDTDFDPDRLAVVQAACAEYSAQGKTGIVPRFVDARPSRRRQRRDSGSVDALYEGRMNCKSHDAQAA
jgi:hypothetical protein